MHHLRNIYTVLRKNITLISAR